MAVSKQAGRFSGRRSTDWSADLWLSGRSRGFCAWNSAGTETSVGREWLTIFVIYLDLDTFNGVPGQNICEREGCAAMKWPYENHKLAARHRRHLVGIGQQREQHVE